MHQRISSVLARSQQDPSTFSLGGARGAPALYPLAALQQAAGRILRRDPTLYGEAAAPGGHPALRAALARLALRSRFTLSPEEVLITHGCTEHCNWRCVPWRPAT